MMPSGESTIHPTWSAQNVISGPLLQLRDAEQAKDSAVHGAPFQEVSTPFGKYARTRIIYISGPESCSVGGLNRSQRQDPQGECCDGDGQHEGGRSHPFHIAHKHLSGGYADRGEASRVRKTPPVQRERV